MRVKVGCVVFIVCGPMIHSIMCVAELPAEELSY